MSFWHSYFLYLSSLSRVSSGDIQYINLFIFRQELRMGICSKKNIVNVASYVQELAKENNVTAKRDVMSRMAVTITALTGDFVELDKIEQLLVNLKKKGILSKTEILQLHGHYICEERLFKLLDF